MNSVQIGYIHRQLPSSWNELSRKQLITLARLYSKGLSVIDFKVRLLFAFLNVKWRIFKTIGDENVYCLGETLSFLLKSVSLTKNPIRRIYSKSLLRIRCYHGPDDAMMNCSFGEFTKAQIRMDAYNTTKDQKYIDELVAILFRPKKILWFLRKHFTESTDKRVRYMDRTLAKRTRWIAGIDKGIKLGIFLFFSGVVASLPPRFPNVYKTKGEGGAQSNGMADLIISLADGKADDESLNRVMNSNMYNVFIGLEQKAKEYFNFIDKTKSND